MDSTPPTPRPLTPLEEVYALRDEVEAAAHARRQADLRLAKAFARLEQLSGVDIFGPSTVHEVGERHGLSGQECRDLLDIGRALPANPLLEQQIAIGKITLVGASIAAQGMSRPELQEPEDDWIEWARTRTTAALARELRRRKERALNGGRPVVPIQTFVSLQTRDDLQRSRIVASRKAGKPLSTGQTIGVALDHYLDTFDEERVTPGERRCPPTALVNGRYVPRAVRREIYERQGQQCAVPYCDHMMFLEKAHMVPHASGGDREAENLVLLCTLHHFFFDKGFIRIVGTAAKPRFFDSDGRDLGSRYEMRCTPRAGDVGRAVDPPEAAPPKAVVAPSGSGGEPAPPGPPAPPPSFSSLRRPDPPARWDDYNPSEYFDDADPPERTGPSPGGDSPATESPRRESSSSAEAGGAEPGGADHSSADFPSWADGPDYLS